MKRAEIEVIAVEIYGLLADDGKWEESLPSVKAFYRKIARWHLIKKKEGRILYEKNRISHS